MNGLFHSVRDLESDCDAIRRARYGKIECADGQLRRVQLKPWPKIGSWFESHYIRGWRNHWQPSDRCRLYYNQPLWHRNYLAVGYLESTAETQLATVFEALRILDLIACRKQSDAILAEVTNRQISDRLMQRLGWQRHLKSSRRRHWIKRFYGQYPADG